MSTTATTLPLAMTHEPPLSFRASGYDYDHEVLVALPASYQAFPDRTYPVLWSMDGPVLFDLTVGIVTYLTLGQRLPEMIVVGVGHPSAEGLAGLNKRTADLFPPGPGLADPGPAADYFAALLQSHGQPADPFAEVKGDRFLEFLVDQLRPALAGTYRLADDHVLFGHSAGAAFAGYAMFAKPHAFSRFVLGSGTSLVTMELESQYAATHADLDAKVFVAAGDAELNNIALSAQRMASRSMVLAENLLLRQYPSLRLKARVYSDEDHYTMVPRVLGDGLAFVFAEEAAALPTMPW